MIERVLALDMSTKTGWAYLMSSPVSLVLQEYGQFPAMAKGEAHPYPASYVFWAQAIFEKIKELIQKFKPHVVVIEETAAGSKSNFSQKILEFIHYLVAEFLVSCETKTRYYLTEEWRRICSCTMTKEESKRNKTVRDYKKKHGTVLARDEKGGIIGLIGRKHVNVRRANELFGGQLKEPLRKKDEDTADALLLGAAYHVQKTMPSNKTNLDNLREQNG